MFFFFFCQSSYVMFLIPLYLPHNFPTMFPHTTFFFFSREEQQSFYLKFNDVTPSTNFLVCSKCVIGDSQQDRNARACFLVKQKKKRRQSNNSTIQKSKQKRKINEKNKRLFTQETLTAHKRRRYVFKLSSRFFFSRQ